MQPEDFKTYQALLRQRKAFKLEMARLRDRMEINERCIALFTKDASKDNS